MGKKIRKKIKKLYFPFKRGDVVTYDTKEILNLEFSYYSCHYDIVCVPHTVIFIQAVREQQLRSSNNKALDRFYNMNQRWHIYYYNVFTGSYGNVRHTGALQNWQRLVDEER